jgi:hypothetical protein
MLNVTNLPPTANSQLYRVLSPDGTITQVPSGRLKVSSPIPDDITINGLKTIHHLPLPSPLFHPSSFF